MPPILSLENERKIGSPTPRFAAPKWASLTQSASLCSGCSVLKHTESTMTQHDEYEMHHALLGCALTLTRSREYLFRGAGDIEGHVTSQRQMQEAFDMTCNYLDTLDIP